MDAYVYNNYTDRFVKYDQIPGQLSLFDDLTDPDPSGMIVP
jgi:hypothetical protein